MFSYDSFGSAISSDDDETDLVRAQRYDAFGVPGDSSNRKGLSFGYRGELHTGSLVHLRNRDYDPVTGTFTTRDPIAGVPGAPASTTPYPYAANDPINKVDPLGLRPSDGSFRPGGGGTGPAGPVGPTGGPPTPPIPPPPGGGGGGGGGPTEEEVLEEIDRLLNTNWRLEGKSIGICKTWQFGLIIAVEGEACGVWDGDELAVIGFLGGGGSLGAFGGASVGALLSNAQTYHQLLGSTACVGGGVAGGPGVGVELCLGLTSSGFTGIWSFWGAISFGLGTEVHVIFGWTEKIFSIDIWCLEGPDFPDLPGRLPDLGKVPSLGCG